jgi:hypothetical protein
MLISATASAAQAAAVLTALAAPTDTGANKSSALRLY